ncbi:ribosomal protein L1 [Zopfia rhizophila CBS 207.26]|uniref:Ribosomal protein L1 n=1 Tax=Zopfia rhizophila CBS 207.26 TaxID=1314779 RepID=A0A6A6DWL0_9PEZI|nr:ribosomal protein L1 [Zopfia rhizophila CBS 207.26]
MSKITGVGVRENVKDLLQHSETKQRNFLETVELQNGLETYDPRRDKPPRLRASVCILVDAMSADDLKKLSTNKKLIKKFARKYNAFVTSDTVIKQIPRLFGPDLSKAGKLPAPVSHVEDIANKITEVKSTIKFQLKKVLDELIGDIVLAINYLVSLLKKG